MPVLFWEIGETGISYQFKSRNGFYPSDSCQFRDKKEFTVLRTKYKEIQQGRIYGNAFLPVCYVVSVLNSCLSAKAYFTSHPQDFRFLF